MTMSMSLSNTVEDILEVEETTGRGTMRSPL